MRTAIALGAAVLALVAAPAGAAAPTIQIKPAQLDRGPDSTIPRMVGDRLIVDGDTRVELERPGYLVGRSGNAYVVGAYPSLVRVSPDGSTQRLTRLNRAGDPFLSGDGRDVLISRVDGGRSTIRVVSSRTGREITTHRFAGYVGVLDADESRAVLTGTSPERTLWWNYRSGATQQIVKRGGGTADISADRLATLTGDPYEGGCAVVTRLSRPRVVLSRSCQAMPVAFSPNGRRMATVYLLADGLGPGEVTARTTRGGKPLATYATYFFGPIAWESNRALVLDAHTQRASADVRCVVAQCERASGVRRR